MLNQRQSLELRHAFEQRLMDACNQLIDLAMELSEDGFKADPETFVDANIALNTIHSLIFAHRLIDDMDDLGAAEVIDALQEG
jgi:hypothetical protein